MKEWNGWPIPYNRRNREQTELGQLGDLAGEGRAVSLPSLLQCFRFGLS